MNIKMDYNVILALHLVINALGIALIACKFANNAINIIMWEVQQLAKHAVLLVVLIAYMVKIINKV